MNRILRRLQVILGVVLVAPLVALSFPFLIGGGNFQNLWGAAMNIIKEAWDE